MDEEKIAEDRELRKYNYRGITIEWMTLHTLSHFILSLNEKVTTKKDE